jgi:hypothetical protein
MAYADRAALITDPMFMGRLNACIANEAMGKPIPDPFADQILRAWSYGGQVFGPLIISLPGFDVPEADVTDGMLLSGVQATWDRAQSLAGIVPAP